tara:strand:+ start:60 stop:500 length:441 start_codon:yes stop_codon:yes gene_type:complete
MRDTLIGITTMTLLFGIVWLSQNKASTNKSITSKYTKPAVEQNYSAGADKIIKEDQYANELNSETTNQCNLCEEKSIMSDDFTFSEAFKLCRECLGNEGIFVWNGNSYSTKVREAEVEIEENNLVVKEEIVSPPPEEDNRETVSSN